MEDGKSNCFETTENIKFEQKRINTFKIHFPWHRRNYQEFKIQIGAIDFMCHVTKPNYIIQRNIVGISVRPHMQVCI